MANHRAGQKASIQDLHNIPQLVTNYFQILPDPQNTSQRVAFGTSGHRGCSDKGSFNQMHILAIAQAVADLRAEFNITGPLFIGKDTHALSEPAFGSVIEVLVANHVQVRVQAQGGYTPTPSISRAIIAYNQEHKDQADGIVITPSHNPPQDGGIKYNPPHGGPAEAELTKFIEMRANAYMEAKLDGVKRMPVAEAIQSPFYQEIDLVMPYVQALSRVIDMDAIKAAGLKMAVDPLGGSGIDYWKAITAYYQLDIELTNEEVDPTFRFMSLDKDEVIRMDCSSPWAMAGLLAYKDNYDLAFGNDPDFDRHGIVTPAGLMNPNHFLAVCIDYLFTHRPQWSSKIGVGKTLVSSAIIDKVVANLGRELCEVPVGFKWFVEGLYQGQIGFGGEESAGASLLCMDASPWTTDKDGIVLCLLAAEITAVTGMDPQTYYNQLADKFGAVCYGRIQAVANHEQKALLSGLSSEMVTATELAGDPIIAKLTHAPGNAQAIGGLKVVTEFGWFAARPSGTEEVYKIYCESFKGEQHLALIQKEAEQMVSDVFAAAGLITA